MDTKAMLGKMLGNHKIVERLGEGGMGVVYKAKQVSLSRMVAMKILPRHLTRETSFVQRFFNEARAIASLNHPNIVQIYDVGREGGNYYYTMELIDGVSLEEVVIQRRPISLDRAIRIISNVAKALDYTHKRGIVHRDIKPSNIMIDKAGRIKLTDFGLALQDKSARLTVEGGLIGTPEFMSPEQASGKTATALSDIYSLGVVFYELMTGSSPFEAETSLAVIERIRTEDAEPPRSLNPELPPEIEEVIMKMMAKNPADRYQDCRELRLDLKLQRTAETVAPPQEEPKSRFRLPKRKVAVGLLAVLAVALVFFLFRQVKGPPRPPKAAPAAPAVQGYSDSAKEAMRLAMTDAAGYSDSAKEAMRLAMTDAAAEMIPLLLAAAGFSEIEAVALEDEKVFLSGEIEAATKVEALKKLSDLRTNLERYCGGVAVKKIGDAEGALSFNIELLCGPSMGDLLETDTMLAAYPLCGRVWQMANEKRKSAESFQRQRGYASAEQAYRSAAALFARSIEIAKLTKEMSTLDRKVPTIRNEAMASGFPDIVVLDNGDKIECEVMSESAASVRIRTDIGTVQFPRDNVMAIIRATPAETQKVYALQSEIGDIQKRKAELKSQIDELHLKAIRDSLADTSTKEN